MNGLERPTLGVSPAGRRIWEAGVAHERKRTAPVRMAEQRRRAVIVKALRRRAERVAALKDELRLLTETKMEQAAFDAERAYRASECAVTMNAILEMVSAKYHVSPIALRGEGRWRQIIVPRHECFWLFREKLGLSFPKIGRFFRRDHTTIMHGHRKHAAGLAAAAGAGE